MADNYKTTIEFSGDASGAQKAAQEAVDTLDKVTKATELSTSEQLRLQDKAVRAQFNLGDLSLRQYKEYLDNRLKATEKGSREEARIRMELTRTADVAENKGFATMQQGISAATMGLGQFGSAGQVAGVAVNSLSQGMQLAANNASVMQIGMMGVAGAISILVMAYQALIKHMQEEIDLREKANQAMADSQTKWIAARQTLAEKEYEAGKLSYEEYHAKLLGIQEQAIGKEIALRRQYLADNVTEARKALDKEQQNLEGSVQSGMITRTNADAQLITLRQNLAGAERQLSQAVLLDKSSNEMKYVGTVAAVTAQIESLESGSAQKRKAISKTLLEERIAMEVEVEQRKEAEFAAREAAYETAARAVYGGTMEFKLAAIQAEKDLYAQSIEDSTALDQWASEKRMALMQSDVTYSQGTANQKKAILAKMLKDELITETTYAQAMVKMDATSANAKIAIAGQVLGQLKHLFKEHTVAYKAIAVAEATINTYTAITKALTAGPILGPILAGLIGAAGFAQVAKIVATKPGDTGGSVSVPTITAPSISGGEPAIGDTGTPSGRETITKGPTVINYTAVMNVHGSVYGVEKLAELFDDWNYNSLRAVGRA